MAFAFSCPIISSLSLSLSLNDPDKNGDPAFRNNRIYQNNVLSNGLFVVISRLNHSCQPSVIWSSDVDSPPFLKEVRALRDIPAGAEMTACYCLL